MIEVVARFKGGKHELARITLENVGTSPDGETADYSVQIAVYTGSGVELIQRACYAFPRKKLNTLALLRLALETLTEEELTLDTDPDAGHSSDLARRLPRPLWPF